MLVGVHHNSDARAEGGGWQVLDELGADHTALSVRSGDSAPDALVVDASLLVLCSVDESDALAMVEFGRRAVLASLDGDKSGVLFLGSLASLESDEKTLGVESTVAKYAIS